MSVDNYNDNGSNVDDVSQVEKCNSSKKSVLNNKKSKDNGRFHSISDVEIMEGAVSPDENENAFSPLMSTRLLGSQSGSQDAIFKKEKEIDIDNKKNIRKRRNFDEPSHHLLLQNNTANQRQKQNLSSMVAGSFLKAFFQNSYNMYIESSLSVRADLRGNHVQRWIPKHVISKSYPAESVTESHTLDFDTKSEGHVLGGTSVPVDPLAGDINKMWLALTMSKNSIPALSMAGLTNADKAINDVKASYSETVAVLTDDIELPLETSQTSFELSLKLSNPVNLITTATATRASSIESNSSRTASCRISSASFSLSCHTDGTDITSSIDDEDIAYRNISMKVEMPEMITIGTQTEERGNLEDDQSLALIRYLFSTDYFSVRNIFRTHAALSSNIPTSAICADSLKSGIQKFFIYYRIECLRFGSLDYSQFSIKKGLSILFLCIYLIFRPYNINPFVYGDKQDCTGR